MSSLIAGHNCNSWGDMDGLSLQLARAVQCLTGGSLADLRNTAGARLVEDAAGMPYLQGGAVNGLVCAMNNKGDPVITINSAFRSLNQQLVNYKWQGTCNIITAAPPGSSNHESGLAVDLDAPEYWAGSMQACGWSRVAGDNVHFNYNGGTDLRGYSVLAFQKIWNLNNPADRIAEDSSYGPATEACLMNSPIRGFARNIC